MREVSLFTAVSLDMMLAGPNGEIDWLFHDQDYGYRAFLDRVDTLIMGRKTFQLVESWGAWPYAGRTTYVFSHKVIKQQPPPNVTFVRENPAEFTRRLKAQSGRTIWLVGGGEINALLLAKDLVDEMILSIHPLWLGNGIPLAKPNPKALSSKWRLTTHRAYPTGLLQTHWQRQR